MDEWEEYETAADWVALGFIVAIFIIGFALGVLTGMLM